MDKLSNEINWIPQRRYAKRIPSIGLQPGQRIFGGEDDSPYRFAAYKIMLMAEKILNEGVDGDVYPKNIQVVEGDGERPAFMME